MGESSLARGRVTISNGQTLSAIVSSKEYHDAWALSIYGPANLNGAANLTIEVNPDPDATAASLYWCTLQDLSGNSITPPPAINLARVIPELSVVGAWRIRSTVAVSADTVWEWVKSWTT